MSDYRDEDQAAHVADELRSELDDEDAHEGYEGCDFCNRPWQFRIRYPRQLDGKGTALWLCKPCAEDMPVDYRPYVEVESEARGE